MIRFRFREDEKRYYALVSEVYRLLGTHLPPPVVSVAMRNLGKLQDLLMLEGVRQGVAAAAISNISKELGQGDLEHLMAFQLHAHIYGSQDTPTHSIEEEWLQKLGAPHLRESPWLDPQPMRFAPDTEHAFAHAMTQETPPEGRRRGRVVHHPGVLKPPPDGDDDPFYNGEDADIEDIERLLDESVDGETQEQPQFLDRVRDALQQMASSGLQPRDWEDLILRLHVQLKVDAGLLDIQLGTAMGRAVLAQTGFIHVQPGPFGTNLGQIEEAAATWSATPVELPPTAAPEEGADGED